MGIEGHPYVLRANARQTAQRLQGHLRMEDPCAAVTLTKYNSDDLLPIITQHLVTPIDVFTSDTGRDAFRLLLRTARAPPAVQRKYSVRLSLPRRAAFPNNAHLVVHSIEVTRNENRAHAEAGQLEVYMPWQISADALRAVANKYALAR
jgi:hypothetical protein